MDHGGQSLKLVLDASMALAWIFERLDAEEAALANHLLDVFLEHEVWITPLWYTEVANVLLVTEHREVITQATSHNFLERLSRLPLKVDDRSGLRHHATVLQLAREHQLSAYDATHLELTLRLGARLATFDRKLALATKQAGGIIFGS
jgi:predicted nucleic acid-binding protein